MSGAPSKFPSLLFLLIAFFACAAVSLAILLFTSLFLFAAWHCNPQPCRPVPDWMNAVTLALLLSHFVVFGAGAYLTRNSVRRLLASRVAQTSITLFFALFPLLAAVALVGYLIYDASRGR